jgi:4-amino-4-deoxy-L-arabinose transferase-like glycosyltransferase
MLTLLKLRKSPAFPYLTLLLWVVPLVLMRSPEQSLMAHDEGIYAIQAKTILETGDWLAPQWGGQVNFDRTIGIQWLIALCYTFLGVNEDAARLPSQLAFIGSVLLLYRIGKLVFAPQNVQQRNIARNFAWLGAAIFAVVPLSVQYARLATQDSMLVLIELLAAWAMLESEFQNRRSLLLLTGAAFGWGFMIKGFMIIPAAIAFLPYLVLQFRQHRHLLNPWLYVGIVIGWLPVVGWLWAATQKYGRQPLNELIFKLFHLSDTTNYDAGPFYYLWNIPANGFPWVFFALFGGVLCLRNIHCHNLIKRHWALFIGFPLTLFVELTVFKTRTHYYPLQLFPWLALFASIAINVLVQRYRQQRSARLLGFVSWGLGGLGLALTIVACLGLANRLPKISGIEPWELTRVSWIGLSLGIGWLGLWLTWMLRRTTSIFLSAKQWLIYLLAPAWFCLALLGLTGLWGDYVPELKQILADPRIAPIVRSSEIDFIVNPTQLYRGGRKRYLLLSYYTPNNGQHLRQWQPVDLAWVDPNLVADRPPEYEILAEYSGWELVRKRSAP